MSQKQFSEEEQLKIIKDLLDLGLDLKAFGEAVILKIAKEKNLNEPTTS